MRTFFFVFLTFLVYLVPPAMSLSTLARLKMRHAERREMYKVAVQDKLVATAQLNFQIAARIERLIDFFNDANVVDVVVEPVYSFGSDKGDGNVTTVFSP